MTLRQLKRKYLIEGFKRGYVKAAKSLRRRSLKERYIGPNKTEAQLYKKVYKSLVAVYNDEKDFAEEEGIDLDLLTIADKWQMNDYADSFGLDVELLNDEYYGAVIQALQDFCDKYRLDSSDVDEAMDIMLEQPY